jgi:hypothetical protein
MWAFAARTFNQRIYFFCGSAQVRSDALSQNGVEAGGRNRVKT